MDGTGEGKTTPTWDVAKPITYLTRPEQAMIHVF
jgi:hypothetical protein